MFLDTEEEKEAETHHTFSLHRLSPLCGLLSFLWLMFTSILLVLPTHADPVLGITPSNFNYTGVIVGGTLILSVFYWCTIRDKYKGPEPLPLEKA